MSYEKAWQQLFDEYLENEGGVLLDDAQGGPLFQAAEALLVSLAKPGQTALDERNAALAAIHVWRKAVRLRAEAHANRMVYDRMRSIEESDRIGEDVRRLSDWVESASGIGAKKPLDFS